MSELFTETIMGAAGALAISIGIAVCYRLRMRIRTPEGVPTGSTPSTDTVVPVSVPPIYYPTAQQQRYTVYMPQMQTPPPVAEPYPSIYITNPYPLQTTPYPPSRSY